MKVETDKMEKNILIEISVLSANYCSRSVHQKKSTVSGPEIILQSTCKGDFIASFGSVVT